tara:strand:+ start:233 stop:631 length:399 start_codon:yes stop_codon:yes gene_type:complete
MSTLRTNALEGVDAKNSITIVAGAGNITTTNVQDGLAKVIAAMDSTATALGTANLNLSSGTDNGTGDYTVTTTNAFTSANDCAAGYAPRSTDDVAGPCHVPSSSTIRVRVVDISANSNADKNTSTFGFGDLA